jgi:hypothetical protein
MLERICPQKQREKFTKSQSSKLKDKLKEKFIQKIEKKKHSQRKNTSAK